LLSSFGLLGIEKHSKIILSGNREIFGIHKCERSVQNEVKKIIIVELGTFNIFQVYQCITIGRQYYLLKFGQFS
jgi:hypothetical protein